MIENIISVLDWYILFVAYSVISFAQFLHVVHGLSVVGYDSDDEFEDEGVHYTRRNKGKKYSKIPKDDTQDQFQCPVTGSQLSDSDASYRQCRVDSVSMYGDSNSYMFAQDSHSERRNSGSIPSSEDFPSDSEHAGKQSYVHVRKEGGISFSFLFPFPLVYIMTLL